MNFIEFNIPKQLLPYIDKITNSRWVLESTIKKWKIKIVWTFTPKLLQNKIEKLYQSIVDKEVKEMKRIQQKKQAIMNKAISNWVKRFQKNKSK